jgi:hypothetical protein
MSPMPAFCLSQPDVPLYFSEFIRLGAYLNTYM